MHRFWRSVWSTVEDVRRGKEIRGCTCAGVYRLVRMVPKIRFIGLGWVELA